MKKEVCERLLVGTKLMFCTHQICVWVCEALYKLVRKLSRFSWARTHKTKIWREIFYILLISYKMSEDDESMRKLTFFTSTSTQQTIVVKISEIYANKMYNL